LQRLVEHVQAGGAHDGGSVMIPLKYASNNGAALPLRLEGTAFRRWFRRSAGRAQSAVSVAISGYFAA
jgi:hypothetical protein